MGLAGLAWNCGIPKKRALSDMLSLLGEPWAAEPGPNDDEPLRESDVRDAMKGYNELGALRPRAMLEKRLSWRYGPPAKRNGRTQEEHLKYWARPAIETYRDLGETEHLPGRPKGSTKENTPKGERICAYAAAHPDATQREIAAALGVSKTTVNKWLREGSSCEER